MPDATAQEHYAAGRLTEAIAAATAEVRQHPADGAVRGFLCELLCFAGDFPRADRQLDALSHQDPSLAVGVALFRQLVRAEQARQQFYAEGRVPEFVDAPSPWLRLHLQASVCFRDRQWAEAANLLAQAAGQWPSVTGTCDGRRFEGLRDLDDLTAPFFEVLTPNGKYYWIPLERVASVEFQPPKRARDLLWRQATLSVRGGPDGEVYFPTLYGGTSAESDDRLRLGRLTDWRGQEGQAVRGVGQRMFQIGEEDRPILEIHDLLIDQPAGA
jgi:type VI secretion system protein ImpE